MKINPVKNPEKPKYPDYKELSKKKDAKKLVAFLAALASLATTLTGCQTAGDVQYEGVAPVPVETEQLAGDVAIDGGIEIETTAEVELMGEIAVDMVFINQYKFCDDGNWEFDSVVSSDESETSDVEITLNDGRRIKFYSGDLLMISGATPGEVFDSAGYGKYLEMYPDAVFPDDKVFYTADGDTILIPDYNNHYIILPKTENGEEIVTLAGDVVCDIPETTGETDGVAVPGWTYIETTTEDPQIAGGMTMEIPEE